MLKNLVNNNNSCAFSIGWRYASRSEWPFVVRLLLGMLSNSPWNPDYCTTVQVISVR